MSVSHRPEGGQVEPRLRLPWGPGGGVAEPGPLAQRVCRQRLLGRVRFTCSLQRTTRGRVITHCCELRQDWSLGPPVSPEKQGVEHGSGHVAPVPFSGRIS